MYQISFVYARSRTVCHVPTIIHDTLFQMCFRATANNIRYVLTSMRERFADECECLCVQGEGKANTNEFFESRVELIASL